MYLKKIKVTMQRSEQKTKVLMWYCRNNYSQMSLWKISILLIKNKIRCPLMRRCLNALRVQCWPYTRQWSCHNDDTSSPVYRVGRIHVSEADVYTATYTLMTRPLPYTVLAVYTSVKLPQWWHVLSRVQCWQYTRQCRCQNDDTSSPVYSVGSIHVSVDATMMTRPLPCTCSVGSIHVSEDATMNTRPLSCTVLALYTSAKKP